MPIAKKHTYVWYYMDMWHMLSKSCVLTQASQADKITSKLLTRGLFVAYHDGCKFVSPRLWSRHYQNMCTKRHTELNLKLIKIGAKYIPKMEESFYHSGDKYSTNWAKAIMEKAQNTHEGLTKEVPIV